MKYAVMIFDTEINIGVSTNPLKLFNTQTVMFDNGIESLNYWTKTPCLWSTIIMADNEDELAYESAKVIEQCQSTDYVKNHILFQRNM